MLFQVCPCENRDGPRNLQSSAYVDFLNSGMGMGGPKQGRVQHSGNGQVRHILALSGKEARVFSALYSFSDHGLKTPSR